MGYTHATQCDNVAIYTTLEERGERKKKYYNIMWLKLHRSMPTSHTFVLHLYMPMKGGVHGVRSVHIITMPLALDVYRVTL